MKENQKQQNGFKLPWGKVVVILIALILISSAFGFAAGLVSLNYYPEIKSQLNNWGMDFAFDHATSTATTTVVKNNTVVERKSVLKQQELVTKAVKDISPSVVSIVITKDMPVYEEYYYSPFGDLRFPQYRQEGTRQKEIGSGTGLIVSEKGMVLTNKHVVANEEANYTVLTNDGKKYSAKVIDTDPFHDIALLQVENARDLDEGEAVNKFPVAELGDSEGLQIGQTVLTIGNALGEFKNTVSLGIVSGLNRTITASGAGTVQTLKGLIQTDAAVNQGNSGGPLVNLKGEVVGINTAMAQSAENIGFAIPINRAKRDIKQIKDSGEITYPFLGVRYAMINEELQSHYDLEVGYGAWVGHNQVGQKTDQAVIKGSAADEAGLKSGDIILSLDGHKLTAENTLGDVIMDYSPGDKVKIKILRDGEEKTLWVKLGKRS
ncbi:MAG: trypsin-like peptidase domain-containing protein [Candidatus Paceibacterota bacterium]